MGLQGEVRLARERGEGRIGAFYVKILHSERARNGLRRSEAVRPGIGTVHHSEQGGANRERQRTATQPNQPKDRERGHGHVFSKDRGHV
jgi:hypothetical protein